MYRLNLDCTVHVMLTDHGMDHYIQYHNSTVAVGHSLNRERLESKLEPDGSIKMPLSRFIAAFGEEILNREDPVCEPAIMVREIDLKPAMMVESG